MKTKNEVEFEGKKYPVGYRHERDFERFHPQNGKLIIDGRTVAFIDVEDGYRLEAYAECSILDQYNRHLGRLIAAGRLEKAAQNEEYFKEQVAKEHPFVKWHFVERPPEPARE